MGWQQAESLLNGITFVMMAITYVVNAFVVFGSFIYIFCKYRKDERQTWITFFLISCTINLILLTAQLAMLEANVWTGITYIQSSNPKYENLYTALIETAYISGIWTFISQYFKVALFMPCMRADFEESQYLI